MVEQLPYVSFSVSASCVSSSSRVRANGGIVGCVWVYMEKVELRYWWEHSDEKNMNELVE